MLPTTLADMCPTRRLECVYKPELAGWDCHGGKRDLTYSRQDGRLAGPATQGLSRHPRERTAIRRRLVAVLKATRKLVVRELHLRGYALLTPLAGALVDMRCGPLVGHTAPPTCHHHCDQ